MKRLIYVNKMHSLIKVLTPEVIYLENVMIHYGKKHSKDRAKMQQGFGI